MTELMRTDGAHLIIRPLPTTYDGWSSVEAQALAQLGYITVVIQPRGVGGCQNSKFYEMHYSKVGRYEVDDHVAVLEQLKKDRAYIFKATFGAISFGNALPAGLSANDVTSDLTVVGSLAGGGDLGNVDLIYVVPEPSAIVLLSIGLFGFVCRNRRQC